MGVRIKVCGFTRSQDVLAAAALDIDLYGFNLAMGPRRISVARAAELSRQVPITAHRVALFVDAAPQQALSDAAASGCDMLQLHGDERPETVAFLARRMPVIKALRVRRAADLSAVEAYIQAGARAILLDAWSPHAMGGSGESWDYSLVHKRSWCVPVILAGGLRPSNVAAAIGALQPQVVDVASGVESAPGIKDAECMRHFCQAVRRGPKKECGYE